MLLCFFKVITHCKGAILPGNGDVILWHIDVTFFVQKIESLGPVHTG